MSKANFLVSRESRNRVLASVALASLAAGGALGWSATYYSHPAEAGPVVTSDLPGQTMPSFATLIERVKPAVVSVKVKIVQDNGSGQLNNLPPEVQRFLHQFGERNGASPNAPHSVMMGLGSGFFISADGYVVTNNHVVKEASSVTVTMDDGKVLDAKVIGTDPKTDLALLKVDQAGDYPYVSLSAQEPRIGDWVVAIGDPYGLGGTVTAGIISAEGRDIGDGPYDRFLQIDAPINKGNSGGPTFNLQGQVVGVNTAIFSPSGGSVGIGFAIPATTVSKVVAALEHGGVVERGMLGVQVQSVGPDIAESLGMKSAQGAIVAAVTTDSPAAKAGLKQGDVVTKVNGEAIKDAGDLTRRIGELKPGAGITLSFVRDGSERTAQVTLAAQPTEKSANTEAKPDAQARPLGLELAPGSQTAKSGEKGVRIVNVDPNGAAAAKGVKSGDIILDVAGTPVSTPEQVVSEIARSQQEHAKAILMRIQTADGADRFVAFPFPKA